MMSHSIGFTTDTSVSGIGEFHIPADQPALIPPIHTATSCSADPHSLSRRICGSNVLINRREVTAMKPRDTIAEPSVYNAPLSPCLHPTPRSHQHHLEPVGAVGCYKGEVFQVDSVLFKKRERVLC